MITLYAITDRCGPPLPASLRAVPFGELAVVVGPAREEEPTPDALWRHEEVIDELLRNRDLLPVRYGARMADDAAAAQTLEPRHDELSMALERVRGAVELSVRVIATADDPAVPADRVHAPLRRLARASSRRRVGPPEILRAAYLVDRDAVAGLAAAVADLQREHAHLRLLCTGPWPPYSFAS